MVLLLDQLVPGIYLYLSILLTVSVILVDLYLSIVLTVSFLLLLEVSTVFFNACDLSVVLTVSILFFDEIGEGVASSTLLCFVLLFLTMSLFPSLSTVSIVVTNDFLISSKSPLDF